MVWDGTERRKFIRRRIPCKIFIFSPEERVISTFTEDICEIGVNLILDHKLDVDTELHLELYLEDEPILCDGRVAWVTEIKIDGTRKKGYKTGVEIKSRIPV